MKPNGVAALLTDFGTADPFVGIMKGVILSAAPQVRVVDAAHGVPPHNIEAGGLFLAAAAAYFPVGTVFAAVVDPGVGTERRAVAVETERGWRVAPDNGLLTQTLRSETLRAAVELTNADLFLPSVSGTFHGRDIFAPAAAHLAAGKPLQALGGPVRDLKTLPDRPPEMSGGLIRARIAFADRFGNLVSNLAQNECPGPIADVRLGELRFGAPLTSYGHAAPGERLCVWNSFGLLELALNCGNLAEAVGWRDGQTRMIRAAL